MFLSCKEDMLEGSLLEKCRIAREAGFSGFDFMGGSLKGQIAEAREAIGETGLKPAAVYGQLGKFSASLIGQTTAEREQVLDLFKERLECTAEIGAESLIFVPRFSDPELRPDAAERALIALLGELAEWAKDIPVTMVMEPLNRKENLFLYDPLMAVRIVKEVGSPNVQTMVDTYHMEMEGQDMSTMIRETAAHLAIVHLSDTKRGLPGQGNIDFGSVLQALKQIGYDGPLGFECKKAGIDELRASINWLNELNQRNYIGS